MNPGAIEEVGKVAANTIDALKNQPMTDANAVTFNSVVAGGGTNKLPVFSDGTAWRIG